MKIEDSGKMEDSETADGQYADEDLECMLEHFIAAKQIEADPKKLALLKEYATSKQKVIGDLFDLNKLPAPKSLKDLKKVYDKKVSEE